MTDQKQNDQEMMDVLGDIETPTIIVDGDAKPSCLFASCC